MRRLARFIDRHWPSSLWVAGVVVIAGGYIVWNAGTEHDPLLARLDADTRVALYTSLASSAGALLGFTIASLAILFTLDPARPLVKRAQSHGLWAMLNRTLLVAAASLALVLGTTTTALAIDNGAEPCVPIEVAVFTTTVVAGFTLLVGGLAFALVVLSSTAKE